MQHMSKGSDEVKDRHFSGFRTARSDVLWELVRELVQAVDGVLPTRKRKRRALDQQMFENQVEAVVCEAAFREFEEPGQWVCVTRSNQKLGSVDRYKSSVMRESLLTVLDSLSGPVLGFLEMRVGCPSKYSNSAQTTFRAAPALLEKLSPLGLSWADFGSSAAEEVIILKEARQDYWTKGERLQYGDTAQTIRYRDEARSINAWLEAADVQTSGYRPEVNLRDRRLRRCFNNGRFDQGGRLFGGFWQGMNKDERRDLLIDGEPAVELDFSQVGPRIIYGMAGAAFERDAYAVPGFERHREGIKKVFGAMTHADAPLVRFPKDTRELFPANAKIADVCGAVQRHHPAIADRFYAGVGMAAMFTESQIMVSALLRMKELCITALPVHDAVIVADSNAAAAEAIMLDAFHHHTGVHGSVSLVQ
jgi:hypothetical protein